MWTIDTDLSQHDSVKVGILVERVSRVHLSTADFPDPVDAAAFAAVMSMSIHGGMATNVVHCL